MLLKENEQTRKADVATVGVTVNRIRWLGNRIQLIASLKL